MSVKKKDENTPRYVMLTGCINENNIREVIKQIFEYNFSDSDKPITLIIDTYGGSVHSMFSLYNTMQGVTTPIYTVGLGKIMSAGALLLAAGEKGHRKVGEHTTLLIHPIQSISFGTIFDQRIDLDESERLQDLMITAYVEETNLTKKKISRMFKDNQDKYYSAKKAVKMGFADEILCRAEKAE